MIFNDSLTVMEPTSFSPFDDSVGRFHVIHFVPGIPSYMFSKADSQNNDVFFL